MDGMVISDTLIRPCTAAEIMDSPEFPDLVAEYAAESKIDGLPGPGAKLAAYARIEHTGFLHAFGAWQGDRLVGFITVLASPMLHYDQTIAVCESFFVAGEHRGGGPGLKLMCRAEEIAQQKGSPVLLFTAPIGSRLEQLLPKCGYTEVGRTFMKRFP